MTKNPVLAATLSVMFLILSVLTMILPGTVGTVVGALLLPLFFVLLAGIMIGPILPAAVGFIAPVVAFFIVGVGRFLSECLPVALGLTAAGIMAGIVYGRYYSSVGAVISGLLFSAVIYGFSKLVFMLGLSESYKAMDFFGTFFPRKIPGLLLCVFGIPFTVVLLRRTGILKVLRDEEQSK